MDLRMDWVAKKTKDFSVVVWSESNQPVVITPVYAETVPSAWPYIEKRATDGNAAVESGADSCEANPLKESFDLFWKG